MESTARSPVAVIGAGGSGLLAAAALRRAGVEFELLEARDGVGGTWRIDEEGDGSACYRSLVANTSKLRMAVGKRRIPGRPWQYAGHAEMLAYFESFADEEGLRPFIRTGWRVESARPDDGGGWLVTSTDGDERRYRAVVCALGTNGRPRFAHIPGEFAGEQFHSASYRTPDRFADRDVLVVGLGTSGAEVAGEAARTARSVRVSVRDPLWMMTRRLAGIPIDWVDDRRWSRFIPWRVRRQTLKAFCFLTTGRSLRRHGLPRPTRRCGDDILAISDAFPKAVRAGRVEFRPTVARAEGRTVTFTDGTAVEVDTIVHATGFEPPLGFLAEEARPERGLYQAIVHADLDGLYFIGLFEAHHALLPTAEEQAAWTADVLSGRVAVPPPEERRPAADEEARRRLKDFGERRPFMLEWATYSQGLRRERRRAGRATARA